MSTDFAKNKRLFDRAGPNDIFKIPVGEPGAGKTSNLPKRLIQIVLNSAAGFQEDMDTETKYNTLGRRDQAASALYNDPEALAIFQNADMDTPYNVSRFATTGILYALGDALPGGQKRMPAAFREPPPAVTVENYPELHRLTSEEIWAQLVALDPQRDKRMFFAEPERGAPAEGGSNPQTNRRQVGLTGPQIASALEAALNADVTDKDRHGTRNARKNKGAIALRNCLNAELDRMARSERNQRSQYLVDTLWNTYLPRYSVRDQIGTGQQNTQP